MKIIATNDMDDAIDNLDDSMMAMSPFIERKPNGKYAASIRFDNLSEEEDARKVMMTLMKLVTESLGNNGVNPAQVILYDGGKDEE